MLSTDLWWHYEELQARIPVAVCNEKSSQGCPNYHFTNTTNLVIMPTLKHKVVAFHTSIAYNILFVRIP